MSDAPCADDVHVHNRWIVHVRVRRNGANEHLLSCLYRWVALSRLASAFYHFHTCAVCDFKTMSARTREGVHVRVLVPSDQYNQAEYALFSATAILTYYQEFFNVTYPLSKLDLMAVPDFSAGAMENWGLSKSCVLTNRPSHNAVHPQLRSVQQWCCSMRPNRQIKRKSMSLW